MYNACLVSHKSSFGLNKVQSYKLIKRVFLHHHLKHHVTCHCCPIKEGRMRIMCVWPLYVCCALKGFCTHLYWVCVLGDSPHIYNNSLDTSKVFSSSTPFWPYISWDNVRFHILSDLAFCPHQTAPHIRCPPRASDFLATDQEFPLLPLWTAEDNQTPGHYLCASHWLAINQRFTLTPSLGLLNFPEQLTGLRKLTLLTYLLYLLISYKRMQINS